MKKIFLLFGIAMSFALYIPTANAQGPREDHDLYGTALGVRLGVYPGISFKQFFSPVSAFEFLVQTKYEGVIGTVLYEAHFQALRAKRLHWILGFGGHVSSYPAGKLKNPDGEVYDEKVRSVGIDGIFGLEYVFKTAPLTLTVDAKPFFDLVKSGPNFFDTAVTIRYAF